MCLDFLTFYMLFSCIYKLIRNNFRVGNVRCDSRICVTNKQREDRDQKGLGNPRCLVLRFCMPLKWYRAVRLETVLNTRENG